MKLTIPQFNVLRGAELQAFAKWVEEIASSNGGLQFISYVPSAKDSDAEIHIKVTEPATNG